MGIIEKYMSLSRTPCGALLRTSDDIKKRSNIKTDICDHLETLFAECLSASPKLIVELGARDGESTFVLERVAKLWNAKLISVDIADCKKVSSYRQRIFVQQDDIEFAKEFKDWCKKNRMEPQIDILFIDTSHLFEHTCQEIQYWFPFLSNNSKVLFHDTNLKDVYFRKDGTAARGWDNERGVVRAIEKYFNRSFNEEEDFIEINNGWLIKHYAHCNGFTILEKIPSFTYGSSNVSTRR
ncbi:MAG: class I SAM-dependent methyltransferase [Thermodesulfobacteriota bacterium]